MKAKKGAHKKVTIALAGGDELVIRSVTACVIHQGYLVVMHGATGRTAVAPGQWSRFTDGEETSHG